MWFLNPFIFIPVLLMLGLVFGACICLVVLGLGFWKKWPSIKRIGAVGLVASLALLLVVGGCYNWMWSPTTKPTAVFKSALGKVPPASVTNIQGEAGGFADSASIYVQFQTDEVTFRSLVPKTLQPLSFGKWNSVEGLFHVPKWWVPIRGDGTQLLFENHDPTNHKAGPRGFSSEATVMTWNPKTGLVQYGWSGID